jgi:hypothetical protein
VLLIFNMNGYAVQPYIVAWYDLGTQEGDGFSIDRYPPRLNQVFRCPAGGYSRMGQKNLQTESLLLLWNFGYFLFLRGLIQAQTGKPRFH